jgi:hypothetical protein
MKPSIHAEVIDPLTGPAWDSLVATRLNHTIFHRSAWARVLAETYGHQPHYLQIHLDESETALVPLMEVDSRLTGRRGVSLPFSDFAGPLSTPSAQAGINDALLEAASARNWKHIEIRGNFLPHPGTPVFRSYDAHQLDLKPGLSAIADRLPPATRRAIQKAERSNLTVTTAHSEEALANFYHLHGLTRRRHGLPPQPWRFFQSIRHHLITPQLGEIVIAHLSGKPVAGAIFLHSGTMAVYKFGASETSCWPLRPNHLVMWHAIQSLIERKFQSLHFGRTSSDDAGLARFKRSWGCSHDPLPYYRPGMKSGGFVSRLLHINRRPLFFSRMPLPLNRLAGRLIYPHLD